MNADLDTAATALQAEYLGWAVQPDEQDSARQALVGRGV